MSLGSQQPNQVSTDATTVGHDNHPLITVRSVGSTQVPLGDLQVNTRVTTFGSMARPLLIARSLLTAHCL